jgi:hypothetical protein
MKEQKMKKLIFGLVINAATTFLSDFNRLDVSASTDGPDLIRASIMYTPEYVNVFGPGNSTTNFENCLDLPHIDDNVVELSKSELKFSVSRACKRSNAHKTCYARSQDKKDYLPNNKFDRTDANRLMQNYERFEILSKVIASLEFRLNKKAALNSVRIVAMILGLRRTSVVSIRYLCWTLTLIAGLHGVAEMLHLVEGLLSAVLGTLRSHLIRST